MVKCFFAASNSNRNFQITVYVDQPGSNNGGSSSIAGDVGHVFVGFKSTDRNTGDEIERLFGFYPASNVTAIVGSLGRVNNNEGHIYDVSITYPVSPSQMSQAAQAALSGANNQYVLSGYNCTNYVETICDTAGITIPESSKKIWEGNTWVFIHSPGKLGKELRALKNSNPSLPIHVPVSPENAPYGKGNCN